jgi:hypothetical protein
MSVTQCHNTPLFFLLFRVIYTNNYAMVHLEHIRVLPLSKASVWRIPQALSSTSTFFELKNATSDGTLQD